jgi:hypothetical protein
MWRWRLANKEFKKKRRKINSKIQRRKMNSKIQRRKIYSKDR